MIGLEERIDKLIERQEDMLGNASILAAVTDTLHVSPNGTGVDGLSWRTAYQTVPDALDAASTDTDDCTLILIGPLPTYYDINTTGDPTWAANVILKGTHRNWAEIRNAHVGATSILKLTGKSAIIDLSFNLGSGSVNGVILTANGFRVDNAIFEGKDLTGAATALWIDGNTAKFGKIRDCAFNGNATHMTGILLDDASENDVLDSHVHACLAGIQIVNSDSDQNLFRNLDICNCALGIDIDAGNAQRIRDINFFNCTTNIDDEVYDHSWVNIFGEFNITTEPDNFVGLTVPTHANAATWGVDTEVRAAVASTIPFRIVGVILYPSKVEKFRIRFSSDSGSEFYDDVLFDALKAQSSQAPSGTGHIFNVGTRISASAQSESGGENVKLWLKIQEI